MLRWSEEDYKNYINKRKNKKDNKEKTVKKQEININDLIINDKENKKSKYKNKKVEVDGIVFDSKKEADFYLELKYAKMNGEILDFELQPTFELIPSFVNNKGEKVRAVKYKGDFKVIGKCGKVFVIDTKGFETKDFKLKKKMFEYFYPQYMLLII